MAMARGKVSVEGPKRKDGLHSIRSRKVVVLKDFRWLMSIHDGASHN